MSVTSTDWFTAALVVITLYYAVTTHRLLHEALAELPPNKSAKVIPARSELCPAV